MSNTIVHGSTKMIFYPLIQITKHFYKIDEIGVLIARMAVASSQIQSSHPLEGLVKSPLHMSQVTPCLLA